VSNDDGLAAFLNVTDDSGTVPLVNKYAPVSWGRLGQAIAGSIAGMVVMGVINIFDAIGTAWQSVIDGALEFVVGTEPAWRYRWKLDGQEGLLDVVFEPLIAAAYQAWDVNVEQFGILAMPVAVAITLASLWFVVRALAEIRGGAS